MDRVQRYLTSLAEASLSEISVAEIAGAEVRLARALVGMQRGARHVAAAPLRGLASERPNLRGATLSGTRLRVEPDMAALANGQGLDDAEATIVAVLAAAEHASAGASGLLAALCVAEQVRTAVLGLLSPGVSPANAVVLAVAAGAGRAMGLQPPALAQAIGLAAVTGSLIDPGEHDPDWSAMVPAVAARSGLFAAMAAHEGMEGPLRPFEGKTGWCAMVARCVFPPDLPTPALAFPSAPQLSSDLRAALHGQNGSTGLAILWAEVSAGDVPASGPGDSIT
jgi:2-methylcitrate dehydratase PrpD